jgi:hypothetical protein
MWFPPTIFLPVEVKDFLPDCNIDMINSEWISFYEWDFFFMCKKIAEKNDLSLIGKIFESDICNGKSILFDSILQYSTFETVQFSYQYFNNTTLLISHRADFVCNRADDNVEILDYVIGKHIAKDSNLFEGACYECIINNNVNMFRYFLKNGVNIKRINQSYHTPLSKINIEIIQIFMDNGLFIWDSELIVLIKSGKDIQKLTDLMVIIKEYLDGRKIFFSQFFVNRLIDAVKSSGNEILIKLIVDY